MIAVVLAAGVGRRMGPLTRDCPKTLLEVGGRTVLGRLIDGLLCNGIRDVCIVTGYRADDVESYVRREYPDVHCWFVRNERFDTTNNIYSMALALESIEIDDDLVLIESDLVFEPEVLGRLLKSGHPNVALVDRYRTGMDGTVVSVAPGDEVITQVIPSSLQTTSFDFSDKFKTLNIYRFSAEFCRSTFKKLLTYYSRIIDDNCYYELILGILIYMQQVQIHAECVVDEMWTEVDDPNDLRIADYLFRRSDRRQYLESSWGGYWNTPVTDFAFIRNMYFPTPAMMSQIRASLPELVVNYGSSQTILNEKLAHYLRCDPRHVELLNGASQVLTPNLRRYLHADRVLLPAPTFGEYSRLFPDAATYSDEVGIDLDELDEKSAAADLVVVVNPNNPTGTTVPTSAVQELATRRPRTRFLVDESFIEFSGQPSIGQWVAAAGATNVLVVKSLSKSLGVPGVRLGYVLTLDQDLHAAIRDDIPIWNSNSIAEYFLEIILKYRDDLAASIVRTTADREKLAAALAATDLADEVYPSGANFVLMRLSVDRPTAARLADRLVQSEDIHVKDASAKFGHAGAYWRIAVRTAEENARLVDVLRRLPVSTGGDAR